MTKEEIIKQWHSGISKDTLISQIKASDKSTTTEARKRLDKIIFDESFRLFKERGGSK